MSFPPTRCGRGRGLVLVTAVVVAPALLAQETAPPAGSTPTRGSMVGDRARRVFHTGECPAVKKISPRSRVLFESAGDASARGFKPCPVCKPESTVLPAASDAAKSSPAPGGNPDEIRFSRDIAPILAANCMRCHNPRDKARRKNFDLSTFAGLMAGGDDGPALSPGNPGESALLLRIKGELQPKMPPGQVNLGESAIQKIETWIKSGARLDAGIDPRAELSKYAPSPDQVRRNEQARKPAAELDQQTEQVGRSRWKKASSDEPEVAAGGRFLLIGSLPADRSKALLKTLDAQAGSVRGLLGPLAGALAGPEKITVFVFRDEKPYIEFVRGNEGREIEEGTTAHANLGVESPYLAAIDPLKGEGEPAGTKKASRTRRDEAPGGPDRTLAGLLTEQLAAGAVASAGESPRWLSLGLGAYLASSLEPRSAYYREQRNRVLDLYRQGWMTRTRELLGGQGDTEAIRAVGFSLIEFLISTNRAFVPPFAREIIKDNKQFDNLIQQNLNATPDQFFQTWGEFVATRYGRSR